MKKDIHPDYHPVVFEDTAGGFRFLTRSTLSAEKTTKWEDGNEYPHILVEVSSATHPFYTGKQMLVDTAKRVDKFQAKLEKQKTLSSKTKGRKVKRAEAKAKKEAKEVVAKTEKKEKAPKAKKADEK